MSHFYEKICTEEDIWDKINDGWSGLSFQQRKVWELVKRMPEQWLRQSYNMRFWTIGLIGEYVIWYDHTEEEFYLGKWTQYGFIHGDYNYGGSWQLSYVVQMLLYYITDQ
jgi:hypothetical protein